MSYIILFSLDPDCVNEVDFLGRCTISYCIHGKTEDHTLCMDLLFQNSADLQHEANGMNIHNFIDNNLLKMKVFSATI